MRRLACLSLVLTVAICTSPRAFAATTVTDGQGVAWVVPEGWSAKKLARGIALTAPDMRTAESYIAMRFDWGFTKADREKLLRVFDGIAVKTLPHLKRLGDSWLTIDGRPVAVIRYRGRNDKGDLHEADYYLASFGKHAVVVAASGDADRLKARRESLHALFLSGMKSMTGQNGIRAFVGGESGARTSVTGAARDGSAATQPSRVAANVDRQLVGRWVRQTAASSYGPGAGVASSTTYTFTFKADGTCTLNITSWVSASSPTMTTMSGPGRGTTHRGTWSTAGGKITIRYANGTTLNNHYLVFDHKGKPALKLFLPGGKPVYYLRG